MCTVRQTQKLIIVLRKRYWINSHTYIGAYTSADKSPELIACRWYAISKFLAHSYSIIYGSWCGQLKIHPWHSKDFNRLAVLLPSFPSDPLSNRPPSPMHPLPNSISPLGLKYQATLIALLLHDVVDKTPFQRNTERLLVTNWGVRNFCGNTKITGRSGNGAQLPSTRRHFYGKYWVSVSESHVHAKTVILLNNTPRSGSER